MKNLYNYIFYLNKKKKKYIETINLNIQILNKKKILLNDKVNLYFSKNYYNKILFINKKHKILKNSFFGFFFFYEIVLNKIFFNNVFIKSNYNLFLKNTLNIKLIKNYKKIFNNYFKNLEKINIKTNMLNIKIAKTNFPNLSIVKNLINVIKILKQKVFLPNNIFIEKIYLSSTLSKSYLYK